MENTVTLMEELREIENVTDINGCFLLRVRDNSIVESTIPIKINQDTLWEIPILRETFQQFSDAVSHGKLEQLTLEGDKGFIFMYNLSPDFILLALGSSDINLAYITLGMLDILTRIQKKLEAIGEELILSPAQEFAGVGENAIFPTLITTKANIKATAPSMVNTRLVSASTEDKPFTQPKMDIINKKKPTKVASEPIINQKSIAIKSKSVPIPSNDVRLSPAPKTANYSDTTYEELLSIVNTLSGKIDNQKNNTLKNVFESLKTQAETTPGKIIAEILDALKDKILELVVHRLHYLIFRDMPEIFENIVK